MNKPAEMIQVFKPYYDEREIQAVAEVIRSGWVGLGPKTAEFEKRFAEFSRVGFCVGLNSGTAALDMALKLLGINHGHEVMVPTMTFVSTAHAVVYNLATPVFVDCDPETLNLDIDDLRRKRTCRTRAIIAVHYGGRPVDMLRLREAAGDIPIIEDCAHAAGAAWQGQPVGGLGAIGCFSFHAVKNVAMGEGGAITLNDRAMAERAKRLRWLGIDKGTWDRTGLDKSYWWEYQVDEIGLKSHLNDIHAAIGLVQLEKVAESNARRAQIVEQYREGFRNTEEIQMPPPDAPGDRCSWHLCEIKAKHRDRLSSFLKERGINTGVHYKPIHLYKCYGNRPCLPAAEEAFKSILTLPLYPGLSDAHVERIIRTVKAFYAQPSGSAGEEA